MGGLTLDTGALIALERARKRIREIVARAARQFSARRLCA
jgi:hypothetical protein